MIVESFEIIVYLDTEFDGITLRPSDPANEKEMLVWMKKADDAQYSLKLLIHHLLFRMHPVPHRVLQEIPKTHRNKGLCNFMVVSRAKRASPKTRSTMSTKPSITSPLSWTRLWRTKTG